MIKLFGLVLISFVCFYSCGENAHDKNEVIKQDSILTSLSAKANVIANVNIIEIGTGWTWDIGQTECTVYGKINAVLKGNVKTGDTIAFTLVNENTLDKNKKDSTHVKENMNYILFLSETSGKAQFGEEQDDAHATQKVLSSADSINFSSQKWFPVYDLTDKVSGIKEYNASFEGHLKELLTLLFISFLI